MQMKNEEQIWGELETVWRQHGDRLGESARGHDLSGMVFPPRRPRGRMYRWLWPAAVVLVCVAALGVMLRLWNRSVVDVFDLTLFLFLGGTLVLTALQVTASAVRHVRDRRPQVGGTLSRHPLFYASSLASVAVLLLFLVLPVPEGRAMSHGTPDQRRDTVAYVESLLPRIR